MITVELRGLRIFGRHGVREHEKRDGQDFLFDVDLDVGERGVSDRLEDAVDYSAVARAVQELSDARTFELLEALAAAIADGLLHPLRRRARACARDEAGRAPRRPRGDGGRQCREAVTSST